MLRDVSELRPYQQRVATWLYEHDEAFAVVRMGGGKTVSALTAIVELLRDDVICHALIVAPLRVAQHVWPEELAAWAHCHDLRYAVLEGSPQRRKQLLATAHQRELTIIGIDNLQWLVKELSEPNVYSGLFDLLVIDEVSRLRNPKGQRARALCKIAGRWRMIWGLTGTIMPSSAQDLFMPVKVVTRSKLWGKSFYKWQKEHFYPQDRNGYRWEVLPTHTEILQAQFAPLTVALLEGELPQIPELTVQFDVVTLPPAAMALYDDMETKLLATLDDGTEILAASAAVATGKLAQIANGFLYPEVGSTRATTIHEAKRDWLKELIEDAEGPLLLLYEFVADLQMMRSLLGSRLSELGDTQLSGVDVNIIDAWNAGQIPFLAMHPASGGHGLNLQAGGHVMAWVAPTWGSELWEQTIARLHRPGQRQPVLCRVCRAAYTVDDLKINRVYHKLSAQAAFERYLRDRAARKQQPSPKVLPVPSDCVSPVQPG